MIAKIYAMESVRDCADDRPNCRQKSIKISVRAGRKQGAVQITDEEDEFRLVGTDGEIDIRI